MGCLWIICSSWLSKPVLGTEPTKKILEPINIDKMDYVTWLDPYTHDTDFVPLKCYNLTLSLLKQVDSTIENIIDKYINSGKS